MARPCTLFFKDIQITLEFGKVRFRLQETAYKLLENKTCQESLTMLTKMTPPLRCVCAHVCVQSKIYLRD